MGPLQYEEAGSLQNVDGGCFLGGRGGGENEDKEGTNLNESLFSN